MFTALSTWKRNKGNVNKIKGKKDDIDLTSYERQKQKQTVNEGNSEH